jgi:PKD repeat protein/alpha-tubulin suppressor-like RCC1 family protein
MKPQLRTAVLLALSALTLSLFASSGEGIAGPPVGRARPDRNPSFARLPLAFEANKGQTDPSVAFMARGGDSTIFFSPRETVLSRTAPGADQAVLRLSFSGAKGAPVLRGEGVQRGVVNYYLGSDPSCWFERVPTFSKVRYMDLYPGVDCEFYGNGTELEFDLVVSPGARPEDIRLRFRDRAGKPLHPVLDGAGGLLLRTAEGEFEQRLPKVWQERDGVKTDIRARYVLGPSGTVGIALQGYDRTKPVVIDPTLVFSTYLGGSSAEYATGVRLDITDDPIVVGGTASATFPTTDGSSLHGTSQDVFVTMMDYDGSGLLFSTIFGGSSTDMAKDVALDGDDTIYVTGWTTSPDFPVHNGYPFPTSSPGKQNAFLTRLDTSGQLVFSTLLRGTSPSSTGSESGNGVTAVAPGVVFVGGSTTSSDFKIVGIPLQSNPGGQKDGFLTKIDTNAQPSLCLTYSTFLGGTGNDEINGVFYFAGDIGDELFIAGDTDSTDFPNVSVDTAFQAHPGGNGDAFFGAIVLPLAGGPPQVQYMTYLGGLQQDVAERVKALSRAVVCVTGWTASGDFFTTPSTYQSAYGGNTDAFVTFFDTTALGASSAIYSTYLGGSGADFAYGASLDMGNGFYIVGTTSSTNFPLVDPLPGMCTFQGGPEDAFVTHIAYPIQRPQTAPAYAPTVYSSTYLGGSGDEWAEGVAVDTLANAVVVGGTKSTNFPTLYPFQASNAGSTDVFVTSIAPSSQPLTVDCTANASPSGGAPPLLVNFTATATPSGCVSALTYSWSFGDSQTSTAQNPSHTYSSNGTYNWSLTVHADTATCTKSGTVTVSSTCTTSCSATVPTTGTVGVNVPFSGTVTPTNCVGSPTFTWSFGDGSPNSNLQNPNHAYVAAGSYGWSMTVVVGGVGCTKSGSILVSSGCGLNCSASAPSSAATGQAVPFASSATPVGCTGTLTYLWDFGNGDTDTSANPVYTYYAGGTYNWTFTATIGAVSCTKSGSISICDLEATASASPEIVFSGQTVQFSSTVTQTPAGCGAPLTYLWDFADGSTSTAANPTHVYVNPYGYKTSFYWVLDVTSSSGQNATAYGVVDVEGEVPGKVYAWGSNTFGQVGDGSGVNQTAPVVLPTLQGALAVAAGDSHSLAIKGDQTVWAWGKNDAGQLGDGTTTLRTTPVQVQGLGGIVGVAAGGSHSIALKNDRTVWAWGLNTSGQLGIGAPGNKLSPVQVTDLTGASTGAAGGQHSLAIIDCQIYGWGDNTYGQVGDGTNTARYSPVAIAHPGCASDVAAGGNHSLAIVDSDDTQIVYGWGLNDHGQVGDGTTANRNTVQAIVALQDVFVQAIAAGGSHSLALTYDGTVYAWGANESGQLGDGTTIEHHTPTLVPGLSSIVAIAAGGSHSFFLDWSGTIWACGANASGQLGHGDTTNHLTPVKVINLWGVSSGEGGSAHSVAVAVCVPLCDAQVPDSATAGTPVAFTGNVTLSTACSGTPTYDWDFGDGSAHSNAQSPTHTYALPGSFDWTFTATINGVSCSSTGTISVCKLICGANATAVTSFPPVVANFTATASLTGPCPGPVSYSWDFGDGTPGGTAQNPSHTYTAPGTFTWTMTASASGLTCQRTGTVTVCGVGCTASASPRYGMAPLTVGFTATASPTDPACTGTPSFDWDYGDGTAHGSGPNVAHLYTSIGRFTWTLTATIGGTSCTRTGTILVTACTLSCSGSVSPDAGTPETDFTFDATTTSPDCSGPVAYDWDFGDGTAHGAAQTVTHHYAAAGTYTWVLRTAQGGVTCLDSGTVYVTDFQLGTLQGFVGICSESAFQPLAGGGVHQIQVYAKGSGDPIPAQMTGAGFYFEGLSGIYKIYATMTYDDNITYANDDAEGGCAAAGVVHKLITSPMTDVEVLEGSSAFQNVCFAPPLVFLHGASSCYTVWNDWNAEAIANGRISFTPNYHWWGDESSWGEKADQVYDQIRLDLAGLVGVSPVKPQGPKTSTIVHWPPYYTVAYDMGGLVARVLTSGYHQSDAPIAAMAGIYLIGVPNSGSDFLLGNGSNDIMSVQAITRRFNLVYPDYGALNDMVYAIGGTDNPFGTGTSDGRVDLYSAFTIEQVACTLDNSGNPVCKPFAYFPFDSDPAEAHLFDYGHDGLVGAGQAMTDILDGIILPATGAPEQKAHKASKAATPGGDIGGDPESPVGATTWGTSGRTVGSTQGRMSGQLAPESTATATFRIGATDGMAVYIFVTSGSGQFSLTRPGGTSVALGTISGDFVYDELSPSQGVWTFTATAGSGGVTYSAAFVEDSTFGIHGYATADHYNLGGTVTLRVDMQGDLTGVAVSSVQAALADPSGNPLTTVTLSPIGGAGSGSYSGTWVAPSGSTAAGAYKATFSVGGTYLSENEFNRQAFDTINVLPPARVFTGSFSDAPLDRNSDGLYDALRFTAQITVAQPGYFVMSADLYDANGNYLATASNPANLPAGPGHLDLSFDLSGAYCVQFDRPFQVENLRFVDAFTLNPLDVWSNAIPTASYAGGTFKCLAGQPSPMAQAVQPDQGVQGQTLTGLQISGRNLKAGATLAFDSGITLGTVTHISDALLQVNAVIAPAATLGLHTLTVTNPDASSFVLPGALTVVPDAPPTVTIISPAGNPTFQGPSAVVTVTVNASDDIRVTHVDLKLNGALVSSITDFPFTWNLSAGSLTSGTNRLVATAYDTKGQSTNSGEADFTYFRNPPTVSSVTGGGSPWQLKIMGTNFQSGVTVTIEGDGSPWSNTLLKNSGKIVLKGGKTLKAKFPAGHKVNLYIKNPDGSSVTGSYPFP